MMISRIVAFALLFLLASSNSQAGAMANCFGHGKLGSCTDQVLKHVQFKAVVLQFVDPDNTGLGETMSRLLWREILESISDVGGAGVILAYDRTGEIEDALGEGDIDNFLQREYHNAAQSIAEQQGAQISIWGSVLNDGDGLLVQPFLTLRQDDDAPWTTFTWTIRYPKGVSLSTPLGRHRLNLAPIQASRAELFERPFVTRCKLKAGCTKGIGLHTEPGNQSPVINHVPVGSLVQVVDADRQWLKVKRSDGNPAWINIYHLEMFPREIRFFSRSKVNLRTSPGGALKAKVNLDGNYQVHNGRRYGKYGEPWYLIQAGDHRGWVAGRLVNQRSYTFPAVHMIAGLIRYGRMRYSDADHNFETFLDRAKDEDNVTQSTASQFLAAGIMANSEGRAGKKAMLVLQDAEELTPFDSRVHILSSVIVASQPGKMIPALTYLERALELNPRDRDARNLLTVLLKIQRSHGLRVLNSNLRDDDAKRILLTLEKSLKPLGSE